MSENKRDAIREELDEWLAAGKIDRPTYDRLVAEQLGEEADDRLGAGLLTGSAGFALAVGAIYLLCAKLGFDAELIWPVAGLATAGCALLATWVVHRTDLTELGRVLAIVGGFMWPLTIGTWLECHPDHGMPPSTILFTLALGELGLAYLSTSALVCGIGCVYLVPAIVFHVVEGGWDPGFGHLMLILSGIGVAYMVAAREHLVWRWPKGVWHRFAFAYQMLGLFLINESTYALSWWGWDGEGYDRVLPRLVCVTATVVLYSLEVWAGQNSRMPGVSMLGIYQFLLQIIGILSYPYLSLEQRAVIIIAYAILLILVAQGESASKRRSA